jgi:hypothetical protein
MSGETTPIDDGRRSSGAGSSLNDGDPGPKTADWDPGDPGQLPVIDGALGREVGDYLILERIGTGGMGVVYRAYHHEARRFVALKLIKAEWWGDSTEGSDREAQSRFRNEAQALAQLEHDHIVPIYDVGHADGLVYFAMRLIKGQSLSAVIQGDGPIDPRRAASYMVPIARAVQHAHDRQILHRDLKPGNVMLDADDRPLLIDLGLCKSLEATAFTSVGGKPMGTAEYMSPEQARGERDVGIAVDIYGLGATLFALLAGRPPFSGTSQAVVLRKVVEEDPDWPAERDRPVGRELKAICLKCLEKDPSRRFRSAGELAETLRRYLDDEPTGVSLPGPWTRLVRRVRRNPWRAAAAAIAVVAAMATAAAWDRTARRDRETVDAFVRDLPTIPLAELPRKVGELEGHRGSIRRRLVERLRVGPVDPELRSRIALTLLASEPSWAIELADRLLACGPEEHRIIREALRDHEREVAQRLRAALGDPGADLGRRARAAAALIAIDRLPPDSEGPEPAGPAWSLLARAEDPDARTELIDWLIRSKIKPKILAARLEREPDPSVRRAILQCLADLGDGRSPEGISPALVAQVVAMYRDDPDPGIHSSLAYLLRRWGRGADRAWIDAERSGKPRGHRRWLVNTLGQTMAVIGPGVGDGPPIARFAIATTETTLEHYRAFDHSHEARSKAHHGGPLSDPELPADAISYDEAARFCNWLSGQEGLPPEHWCYLPGDDRGGMLLAPDYLSRRGYRLPSLREWEYAARAGTTTDRYFGRSTGHAGDYAWFLRNSSNRAEPVGRKRPNDFGLFDALGNVLEWCYNPDPPHDPGCDCRADLGAECRKTRLVSMRGGSFHESEGGLSVKPLGPIFDRLHSTEKARYIGFRIVKSDP